MAVSGDILGCHNLGWGGRVLLAPSGSRSQVLLNIPRYTGQPPP